MMLATAGAFLLVGCGRSACVIDITSPTEGQMLSEDDNPSADGFQVDVDVTVTGVDCTRISVRLQGEAQSFEGFSGETFSTQLTLPFANESSDMQRIVVDVQKPDDDPEVFDTADRSVTVTARLPMVTLMTAATEFTAANSTANGGSCDATGFTGDCSEDGVDVELVTGTTVLATTSCSAGSFDFGTVSLPQDDDFGAYDVFVRQTLDGQTGESAAVSLRSDCVAPTIAFADGSNRCGGTVGSLDDTEPEIDGVQFPTSVTSADNGGEDIRLVITSDVSGETFDETRTPVAETVSFDDADYGDMNATATLVASTTDPAGNPAEVMCTTMVVIGPGIGIGNPADGSLATLADDCDAADGFQLLVTGTSDAAEGTDITVTVDGDASVTQVDGAGRWEICVDAMNGMDLELTASVTDDRGTSEATRTYSVLSDPPTTPIALTATVTGVRPSAVDLEWTAVGDALGGAMVSYELRCAAEAIVDEDGWDEAFAKTLATATPAAAGMMEMETTAADVFRAGEDLFCVLRGTDRSGQLTPIADPNTQITLSFGETAVTPGAGTTRFGKLLAPVGDVTGDGIDDLLVAADDSAFLYFGSDTGLSESPDVTFVGEAMTNFAEDSSQSIAGIGDFDNDGISDFAIGSSFGGTFAEGAVYVFFGRDGGDPVWPATINVNFSTTGCDADVCYVADDGEFSFTGLSVSAAGDFDGDGIDDLLIGAPGFGVGMFTFEGRAFVIKGAAGLSGLVRLVGDDPDGFVMVGTVEGAGFGNGVTSLGGDVTGDVGTIFDDIVIGAPGRTAPTVVEGEAIFVAGRAHTGPGIETIPSTDFVSLGTGPAGEYATVVHGLGDVDGDGNLDVGVFEIPNGGSTEVFTSEPTAGFVAPNPSFFFQGRINGDYGRTAGTGMHPDLGLIGDIDGDGVVDVVFGARQREAFPGSLDFFYGGRSMDVDRIAPNSFRQTVTAGDVMATFARDLNGDGLNDIVRAEPDEGDTGRIVVLF